jgi:hypothetical protein
MPHMEADRWDILRWYHPYYLSEQHDGDARACRMQSGHSCLISSDAIGQGEQVASGAQPTEHELRESISSRIRCQRR